MTAIIRHCLGVLILVLLAGCIVQSMHPFYTEQSRVKPNVVGDWDLLKSLGKDVSDAKIKPWVFKADEKSGFKLEATDEQNASAEFLAQFFKVGEEIYCDLLAGELKGGSKANQYWLLNVRPVHTLYRAELKSDLLKLTPLDYEWFAKALEQKVITVPFIKDAGNEDSLPLFTATPTEWGEFLQKHGANTNAFSAKSEVLLRRRQGLPAEPKEKAGTDTRIPK